jgi:hypothetical protein
MSIQKISDQYGKEQALIRAVQGYPGSLLLLINTRNTNHTCFYRVVFVTKPTMMRRDLSKLLAGGLRYGYAPKTLEVKHQKGAAAFPSIVKRDLEALIPKHSIIVEEF